MENNTNFNNNINTPAPTFEQMMALFAETKAIIDRNSIEAEKRHLEAEKEWREIKEQSKITERKIKELGKQIGGVHQSIGKLTESLFFKSLKKLLMEKFHVQMFEPNAYRESEDKTWIEIDALAVVNGDINSVFITEIKTKFSQDVLKQLEGNLTKFNKHYPEFKDRKKYGILAVPHLTEAQKSEVLNRGFYPAIINEYIAMIDAPNEFKAREY